MKLFVIKFECVNGAQGWGITGSRTNVYVIAENKEAALIRANNSVPGGWKEIDCTVFNLSEKGVLFHDVPGIPTVIDNETKI